MPKIVLGKALRISFSRSTIKFHLKLGTFFHFYSLLVLNPAVRSLGILSRCKGDEDGRHCLFLDYDDAMLENPVIADIKRAQRQYDAGPAVILQSGESDRNAVGKEYGSYHVIFCAKFLFEELVEIISKTHCDYGFRDTSRSFNHRAYVLRIYPKVSEDGAIIRDRPVFRQLLYAPTGRETCTAMYDFLKKWYGIPDYPANHDGSREISVLHYNTTGGWRMAITDRFKKLAAKIRMQMDVF